MDEAEESIKKYNDGKLGVYTDVCVVCGEPVPEGYHVCPKCSGNLKNDESYGLGFYYEFNSSRSGTKQSQKSK